MQNWCSCMPEYLWMDGRFYVHAWGKDYITNKNDFNLFKKKKKKKKRWGGGKDIKVPYFKVFQVGIYLFNFLWTLKKKKTWTDFIYLIFSCLILRFWLHKYLWMWFLIGTFMLVTEPFLRWATPTAREGLRNCWFHCNIFLNFFLFCLFPHSLAVLEDFHDCLPWFFSLSVVNSLRLKFFSRCLCTFFCCSLDTVTIGQLPVKCNYWEVVLFHFCNFLK